MSNISKGTIAAVAQELIAQAKTGMLVPNDLAGNTEYQRRCDTFHEPSSAVIAVTRNKMFGIPMWHVSISFRDVHHKITTFNPEIAELWLKSIYGGVRDQVKDMPGLSNPDIRHFVLVCPGQFAELPVA